MAESAMGISDRTSQDASHECVKRNSKWKIDLKQILEAILLFLLVKAYLTK